MYILGISSYYHDSAAALIKDGRVLAAAEEERFSRIKHDNQFPKQAALACLKQAKLTIDDIYAVAYYEKPLVKFERILETFVATYPCSLRAFSKAIPEWLGDKIKVEHNIRKHLGFRGKIYFVPHHLSHAAAAFYPSPYKQAAILTIDGVGEYQTTGLWYGQNTTVSPLKAIDFPHSLGLLYSTFTAFLGFQVNNDEYKMMGLAAYGKPKYMKKIYKVIDVKPDGSFRLNLEYFAFRQSFTMWSKKFEMLFGPPRNPREPFTSRHKDLAASIQKATENIYFKILNHLHSLTKSENLCIAGGVALNSLANGKIYENTPFKKVYNLGPAGDSGASLGAALYTYHSLSQGIIPSKGLSLKKSRQPITCLYFGSSYSNQEIEQTLKKYGLKYKKFKNSKALVQQAAKLLAQNKIIGWFQGKMEFGPRALGARSILANPQDRRMKTLVNKIKLREQFRPFAGSVLQERVHELFCVPEKNHYSPFMNFCFKVRPNKRAQIAAIVHADNTCRIQTVNKRDNGIYYELIKEFYRVTGIPCLLNTSFNTKVEPIVENPKQAIEDFLNTQIDCLVLEGFLVYKANRRG